MLTINSVQLLVVLPPWVPIETVTSEGKTVVGYVLEADDDTLTVLQHDPRIVIRMTADDAARSYCHIAYEDDTLLSRVTTAGTPLISYLATTPETESYPACPIEE